MDERLTAFLSENRSQFARSTEPATGDAGELATAEDFDGQTKRTVLVTAVDERTQVLQVLLVTNEIDMATDFDLLIEAGDSQAGYDLLAQGELYGSLFREQLRTHLGNIKLEDASAVANAVRSDAQSLRHHRAGPPVAHEHDPRREFKETELKDLRKLTQVCREFLLDGAPSSLAPDLDAFLPPPPGTDLLQAQDHFFEILELVSEHPFEIDLFDFFSDDQLSELARWRTEFGLDLIARISAAGAINPTQDRSELVVADSPRASMLQTFAKSGVPTVAVVTSEKSAWNGVLIIEEEQGGTCRAVSRLVGANS